MKMCAACIAFWKSHGLEIVTPHFGPAALRSPHDGTLVLRAGKHRAGRLLDGVEHNEYPAVVECEQ